MNNALIKIYFILKAPFFVVSIVITGILGLVAVGMLSILDSKIWKK